MSIKLEQNTKRIEHKFSKLFPQFTSFNDFLHIQQKISTISMFSIKLQLNFTHKEGKEDSILKADLH